MICELLFNITETLFLTKEWHGWGSPAHTGLLGRLWGCFVNFKLCSNIGLSLIRRGSCLKDPFTQDISHAHIISKWRASPLQWPARPCEAPRCRSPACPTSFPSSLVPLQLLPCADSILLHWPPDALWPQIVPPRALALAAPHPGGSSAPGSPWITVVLSYAFSASKWRLHGILPHFLSLLCVLYSHLTVIM